MPIYEYGCNDCGHTLDALQKIADPPLVDCPECGKSALRRLISAPRFRLKGDGWYETDFKKDNQRNLAKSDADGDAGGKSDKADKADGKSDGKSDGSEKKVSEPASKSDKAKPVSKSPGTGSAASAD